MARLDTFVLDTWASIDHKQPMRRPRSLVGGDWMDEQDRRRLTAYMILAAYRENVSRTFLSVDPLEEGAQDDHREYGDAALVVEQSLSAILGDEQHIVVAGAEPEGDQDEGEPAAVALQDYLREWADRERFVLKLLEVETDAVTTGDGVYLLAWDKAKQRVRLRTLDPGFYFPVLDDGMDDDYPTRVHLAWELEGDALRGIPRRLRRITYELAPISYATEVRPNDSDGWLRRVIRWGTSGDDPEPQLIPGDRWDNERGIVRQLAWNDEPTNLTCYLTDATWDLDKLELQDRLDDLPLDRAVFGTGPDGELLERLDLGFDFLPVVHLPNTVARRAHYGTSSLARILQLLDDVAATDTDLQAASSTAGSPPIGLSGASVPVDSDGRSRITVAPGEVWNLGPDGKLSTVDTSPALQALGLRVDALLSRLSANARLPEAVLGRVSPADVPSGFAVALTFGPLQAMVRSARLSRGEKYPLLLKMVARLSVLGGAFTGELLPAELTFGSYLPSDVDGVIDRVRKLLTPPAAVSLETAVAMLQEAGVPIEDVSEEVQRIERRAFEAANQLADATGDQDAVREFLGLEGTGPAPVPAPPALPIPATPPAGALPAGDDEGDTPT